MGDQPQVLYRMFDEAGALLYVGVSMNVAQRFAAHRAVKDWWGDIRQITLEHHAARNDVLQAETLAIRTELPRYNLADSVRNRTLTVVNASPDVRLSAMELAEARVVAAVQQVRALEAEIVDARTEERAAILAVLATGTKQVRICKITGFSREYIRRITLRGEADSRATGTWRLTH